jgi:hypothetical protein
MIGFFERLAENSSGTISISGWTKCKKVLIQIFDLDSGESVFEFFVKPDISRNDLKKMRARVFTFNIDSSLVGLFPKSFEVRGKCDNGYLNYHNCDAKFEIGGGSVEVLRKKLSQGLVWNRKSGKLYLPISNWPEHRICESIHLVSDLFDVSKGRVLAGYGTLLGLVRDGELIPWDDDVDVMLMLGGDSLGDFVDNYVDTLRVMREHLPLKYVFFDDFAHVGVQMGSASVDLWPVWNKADGEVVDVVGSFRPSVLGDSFVQYLGNRVHIPSASDDYLKHSYGKLFLKPNDSWRPQRYIGSTKNTIIGNSFRSSLNSSMIKFLTI